MTNLFGVHTRNQLSRPHSIISALNNNPIMAAARLPRDTSITSAFKPAQTRRSTRIESKQQENSVSTIRKAESIVQMGKRNSSIHSVTSTRKRE